MPEASQSVARGKVIASENGSVVFAPANTTYRLHLQPSQPFKGPMNELVSATVRAKARKIYTVPSGGGFVAPPIYGPPRTIQGRVVSVNNDSVVIRAGLPIVVELPKDDSALDLEEGPIAVGSLVNAVALPGAQIDFGDGKIVKK